jgi:hypothetical protein
MPFMLSSRKADSFFISYFHSFSVLLFLERFCVFITMMAEPILTYHNLQENESRLH